MKSVVGSCSPLVSCTSVVLSQKPEKLAKPSHGFNLSSPVPINANKVFAITPAPTSVASRFVHGSLPLNLMADHPTPKLAISKIYHPLEKGEDSRGQSTERVQRR
jgi:hypothetical protein